MTEKGCVCLGRTCLCAEWNSPYDDFVQRYRRKGPNVSSGTWIRELTLREAVTIADDVRTVAAGNPLLRDAFYRYYAFNALERMSHSQFVDPTNPYHMQLANTDAVQGTVITPQLNLGDGLPLAVGTVFQISTCRGGKWRSKEFPDPGLGNCLLHELVHTSAYGGDPYEEEGRGYGAEAAFCAHANRTARKNEIVAGPAAQNWQGNEMGWWKFNRWYLLIMTCWAVIDGRLSLALTQVEAQEVMVAFVLEDEPIVGALHPNQTKIVDYVDKKLSDYGWATPNSVSSDSKRREITSQITSQNP